jgi:uncharacterized protein involved in exopolysaccharide biosynthesis
MYPNLEGGMGRNHFSLLDDNLREFALLLRRNLRFLLLYALVVGVLAGVITVCLPREWRMIATVQVKGGYDSSLGAMLSTMSNFQMTSPATNTEMQILRARFLREQAIATTAMQLQDSNLAWDTVWGRILYFVRDKLPLVRDVPTEYLLLSDASIDSSWNGKVLQAQVRDGGKLSVRLPDGNEMVAGPGEYVRADGLSFRVDEVHAPAGRKFKLTVYPLRETLRLVAEHSGVFEAGVNSGVVAAAFIWHDPHRGAEYLNALITAYLEDNENYARTVGGSRLDYLKEQISRVEKALRASEVSLAEFKKAESTIALSEESKALIQNYSTRKLDLEKARMDLGEAKSLLAVLRKGKTDDFLLHSTALTQDPVQVSLVQQLADREYRRSVMLEEMTEQHPDVQKVNASIAELKGSIIANLESKVHTLEQRDSSLSQSLVEYEGEILAVPGKERDLAVLMRDNKVNENLYYFLVSKLQETQVFVEAQGTTIRRLDAAVVPDFPQRPSVKVNGVLGLIMGFIAALLLVTWRAYGSGSVRNLRHARMLVAGRCIALATTRAGEADRACGLIAAELPVLAPDGGTVAFVDLTAGRGAELVEKVAARASAQGKPVRTGQPGASAQSGWTLVRTPDLVAAPEMREHAAAAAARILLVEGGMTSIEALQANAALVGTEGLLYAFVAGELETESLYSALALEGVRQ